MGYEQALEAAGADVLIFESFGTYQGDWWAKVKYNEQIGWVHGQFGSCSHCDSFQREFYYERPSEYKGKYYIRDFEECSYKEYIQDLNFYDKRLGEFGETYLKYLYSQEEAVKMASENLEWDMSAQCMVDFIKNYEFKIR